jgi:hypothetical protein
MSTKRTDSPGLQRSGKEGCQEHCEEDCSKQSKQFIGGKEHRKNGDKELSRHNPGPFGFRFREGYDYPARACWSDESGFGWKSKPVAAAKAYLASLKPGFTGWILDMPPWPNDVPEVIGPRTEPKE